MWLSVMDRVVALCDINPNLWLESRLYTGVSRGGVDEPDGGGGGEGVLGPRIPMH